MEYGTTRHNDPAVSCSACQALCCGLEVLLITDTGVPEEFIETDKWGGMTMARTTAGWCSALDRTSNLCRIYENRPWICREFEMGGLECVAERTRNAGAHSEWKSPRQKD